MAVHVYACYKLIEQYRTLDDTSYLSQKYGRGGIKIA